GLPLWRRLLRADGSQRSDRGDRADVLCRAALAGPEPAQLWWRARDAEGGTPVHGATPGEQCVGTGPVGPPVPLPSAGWFLSLRQVGTYPKAPAPALRRSSTLPYIGTLTGARAYRLSPGAARA